MVGRRPSAARAPRPHPCPSADADRSDASVESSAISVRRADPSSPCLIAFLLAALAFLALLAGAPEATAVPLSAAAAAESSTDDAARLDAVADRRTVRPEHRAPSRPGGRVRRRRRRLLRHLAARRSAPRWRSTPLRGPPPVTIA